jgi:hypothetical protein
VVARSLAAPVSAAAVMSVLALLAQTLATRPSVAAIAAAPVDVHVLQHALAVLKDANAPAAGRSARAEMDVPASEEERREERGVRWSVRDR